MIKNIIKNIYYIHRFIKIVKHYISYQINKKFQST